MKKVVLAGVVLGLFVVAHGAQIVQTHTIETHGPGTVGNESTDAWIFNEFNDNGGTYTLDSVQIQFVTRAWGGWLATDNDGEETATGVVSFNIYNTLLSDKSLLDGAASTVWATQDIHNQDTFSLDVDDDDGAGYQAGGLDWDEYYGPTEASADVVSADVTIHDFFKDEYIGAGTFNMSAVSYQTIVASLGGDTTGQFDSQDANGSVTLIYNYTVPEPASIAMIGVVGAVAFGLRRRFMA